MSLAVNILSAKSGTCQLKLVCDRSCTLSSVKELIIRHGGAVERDASVGFMYTDEEGDCIVGRSELEWSTLTNLARISNVAVDVFPLIDQNDSGKQTKDTGKESVLLKSSCCPSKGEGNKPACCPGKSIPVRAATDCKPSLSDCCNGMRTCPKPEPEALAEDLDLPPKIVNPTLPQYKYTAESLRCVALPLGGLGGGSVSIAGDGGLRQWQISNKINHLAAVPDSFFAIKVGSTAVVLQSSTWYDQTGFRPSTYISDHVVPQCSKDLLSALPGVKTVEIVAKYPVVEVDYTKGGEVSVDVHLEAWSPKVPHESVMSALPVVVFDFHVTNNSTVDKQVSLLSCMQNLAGWDGLSNITGEVQNQGYGGNVNSLYTSGSFYGVDMSSLSLPDKHAFNGHVANIVSVQDGDAMSTMLQFDSVTEMWKYFAGTGLPGQGHAGPSAAGHTWNSAVCCTRNVPAGKTSVFTFLLAWHFPNRYKDWSLDDDIPNTDVFIGTYYSKIWKSMSEVLSYTASNLASLRTLTYTFRDSMFNSTLPWQLLDSAAGRISVLNSPTCMWTLDGNFYAFEGCSQTEGCCPLNCTHVWNYEMALAHLYPDLERTMREVELLHQISPYGVIPSRVPLPLMVRRWWAVWKDYSDDPASTRICVDGEMGTVLKTLREVRLGASKDWFDSMWLPCKKIMERWLNVLDDQKLGLIWGAQPNTFDVALYGYNTLIGCLYLCGLRAAEEMAKMQEDLIFAEECRARFDLGSANLDKVCFTNGKWYTQVVDPNHATNIVSDATFIGTLYGQWWAHLLDLGYLLPKEHIVSHLKYTVKNNYVPVFDPRSQQPRQYADQRDNGWTICAWTGTPPDNRLYYSTEACWSGLLYPFAGLLLQEGLIEEALNVLQVNRYWYDGTRRDPWNEIECGDHYSRPLASFSLYQIASGMCWKVDKQGAVTLSFAPRIGPDDFRGFFALGSCWGQFVQKVQKDDAGNSTGYAEVCVSHGSLELRELGLAVFAQAFGARKNDEPVRLNAAKRGKRLTSLRFSNNAVIGAGETLLVIFK